MKKLAKKLHESVVDISSINIEQAIKYYEEGRKLEWKRLSTTQTSSETSLKKEQTRIKRFYNNVST